jgi:hypothetical protein
MQIFRTCIVHQSEFVRDTDTEGCSIDIFSMVRVWVVYCHDTGTRTRTNSFKIILVPPSSPNDNLIWKLGLKKIRNKWMDEFNWIESIHESIHVYVYHNYILYTTAQIMNTNHHSYLYKQQISFASLECILEMKMELKLDETIIRKSDNSVINQIETIEALSF